MSSKFRGIQLSKELQKELCTDSGWDYDPNRTYEFSYSIGGIILSEHTSTGEKTDEVLIPYTREEVSLGDKFLDSTLEEMKKNNRKLKAILFIVGVLATLTVVVPLVILHLL